VGAQEKKKKPQAKLKAAEPELKVVKAKKELEDVVKKQTKKEQNTERVSNEREVEEINNKMTSLMLEIFKLPAEEKRGKTHLKLRAEMHELRNRLVELGTAQPIKIFQVQEPKPTKRK